VMGLTMVAEIRRHTRTSVAGRRFFRHPTAAPGLFVLAFFVTVALAAPLVAPYRPYQQIDIDRLADHAPSTRFLLGTDPYSRDVWSRLAYGARSARGRIVVSAALGIGNVMLLEAGLSFLGLGVPSTVPSWGNMIADGWHKMAVAWWSSTFPGLAISLVVMALNAVGDALRDALDPRREAA